MIESIKIGLSGLAFGRLPILRERAERILGTLKIIIDTQSISPILENLQAGHRQASAERALVDFRNRSTFVCGSSRPKNYVLDLLATQILRNNQFRLIWLDKTGAGRVHAADNSSDSTLIRMTNENAIGVSASNYTEMFAKRLIVFDWSQTSNADDSRMKQELISFLIDYLSAGTTDHSVRTVVMIDEIANLAQSDIHRELLQKLMISKLPRTHVVVATGTPLAALSNKWMIDLLSACSNKILVPCGRERRDHLQQCFALSDRRVEPLKLIEGWENGFECLLLSERGAQTSIRLSK